LFACTTTTTITITTSITLQKFFSSPMLHRNLLFVWRQNLIEHAGVLFIYSRFYYHHHDATCCHWCLWLYCAYSAKWGIWSRHGGCTAWPCAGGRKGIGVAPSHHRIGR
jgi:hypothetical protein